MNRTQCIDISGKVDEKIRISGWVQTRRDHGKLIFLDVRDSTGLVQVVFWGGGDEELFAAANELRSEYVVEIEGTVQKRGEKQINPDAVNGSVELAAESLVVIAESDTPPFVLDDDKAEVGEPIRMKHRYLDLRTERMASNMRMRHKVIKAIRDFLDNEGFIEIETPILAKSSPEGARDFLVPSRLSPGEFYALPQAPQQFKQLLMISGFEKYYQIARCFRDEDLRGDRQPEFTQLDMEMSFVSQDDVLDINERLFKTVIADLYPNKRMPDVFPRMTYDEVMDKYGSDKPDIREDKEDNDELAFLWVTDFPVFEESESGELTFAHNPFASPVEGHQELIDSDKKEDNLKARAQCYDLVLNGYELSSGSIRIHDADVQRSIFKRMGLSDDQIQEQFGEFLEAFKYGAPPHGGMAPGLDRVVMILQEEPTIREVIAFPKNGDMRDLMFNAPGEAKLDQLTELGITVSQSAKK